MFLYILRFLFRLTLRIIARTEVVGLEKVPDTGAVAVVSNHLGIMDVAIGILLTNRTDLIVMTARKHQKKWYWRFLVTNLNGIWLNRGEADVQTIREVHKRLKKGEIIGIAPEGTRSKTEALQKGKPGAVYMASKADALVIPVGITGSEDRVVKARLKKLKRLNIKICVGDPYRLPPMDRKNRDAYLKAQTEEMMCRIGALLPEQYRGVYADHPRLQELLAERPIADPAAGC